MGSAGEQNVPRRISPAIIAAVVLAFFIGSLAIYLATRNSDQDKLKDPQLVQTAGIEPEKRCSAPATFDLLKRTLFQRAAQLRGGDQGQFAQLANSTTLRMEDPAFDSQDKDGAINCSGSASLDLPAGFAVNGGSRTLTTDLDYAIQAPTDGATDTILVRNGDSIVAALATLSRTEEPASEPDTSVDNGDSQEAPMPSIANPPSTSLPEAAPPAAPPAVHGQAAFDCSSARTQGEIAVCSDPGLAALDQTMTTQYRRALTQASPEDQALLRSTGRRFVAYRDSCPNRTCMGNAYVGRMQEIRDIMEGRWQPPR